MIRRGQLAVLAWVLCSLAWAAPNGAAPLPPRQRPDLQSLNGLFASLKPAGQTAPTLRPVREDWDDAGRRIRSDPGWQTWMRTVRTRLDAWMLDSRDRPEWIAGYPHDLIDPATGLPVRWTPEMVEPPLGDYGSARRKFHEAWVARWRAHNLDRIQEATRFFRLTGERRYADWAAEQLDFYARHYASWPLQQLYGSRSRMLGQGLDEATATTRLIDAVRLLRRDVTTSRRMNWRENLFMPIVDNLRRADVGVNNISLWHAVATALVAMEYEDQALLRLALDGPMGVRAVMDVGVTQDFIWYEGSLGYQTYVLRALAPLLTQAGLRGQGSQLDPERLLAQNMLLAPLMLRFDDGSLPSPGDVTARLKAVDLDFFVEVYRPLPSLLGLAEAARRRNWDTLLDPVDPQPAAAAALPAVRSVDLPGVRMALLKQGEWQVFLRYGQVTTHHSHEDALNHEIYFGSTPVSTDPGTVLYGSPMHENYFRRAVAHNIATIDGSGQSGWAPGELQRLDTEAGVMLAQQPRYRPDAAVRREVRIEGGALVDRLATQLSPGTATSRRLGFLFHTDCTLTLIDAGPGVEVPAPVGRGFSFWEQVSLRRVKDQSVGRLRCGQREFEARWRWSTAGRLYVAQAPTTPIPAKRTVVYFETLSRDAEVEMRLMPIGDRAPLPR